MQVYKCLKDKKLITDKAISKGICKGHKLILWNNPKDEIVKKVAISIPTEGHTLPEAYDNHLLFMQRIGGLEERWRYEKRSPRYEFWFYTTGRLLTQMAREKLVKTALETGMDYIVMFDDDMLLPINMIEKFLENMEQKPEIDVLAALAFMRNPPHYPVIYTVIEGYDSVRHTDFYFNQANPNYPRDVLIEADAVGFGAVIIKMDLIKKLKEPYFMSTTATGEDIMFCVNARKQAKARIFMDTRIKTGHLSNPRIVDETYFDKWIKDNKHRFEKKEYKYDEEESEFLSYDKALELDR